MKTNVKQLVKMSVQGQVSPPVKGREYTVKHDGQPMVLPGVGGITYNVKIGDPVMDWVADHVEPGVSMKITGSDRQQAAANAGLNTLACIGNKARIISGDAKGSEGYVTGKHGGIEHVLVYFEEETLEKMTLDDKILIQGYGVGLKIEELPGVKVMNLDPELFGKMNLNIKEGKLEVPVAGVIPPELMGSGLGAPSAYTGDYDLTTQDREMIKELGLDKLRFGDIVALENTDNSYGRCFKRGAVSIGVVVHSDCVIAGHGPGITTIFTSAEGKIKPVKKEEANIGTFLGILGEEG